MSSDGVDGRDDLSVTDTGKFNLVVEKQPVYRHNVSLHKAFHRIGQFKHARASHLSGRVLSPNGYCPVLPRLASLPTFASRSLRITAFGSCSF